MTVPAPAPTAPRPTQVTTPGAGRDPAAPLLARCRFPDPSAGPVVMAVSGGADSMALMVLARRAGLDGRAVHVEHGLRGDTAHEGLSVAQAARALGFAFEQRVVDVPPGPDLEARARRARYGALPPGVLTGHTMDDQAETVVLNMLRGAGLDGLSGMRSGFGPYGPRRPLLGLRRFEAAEVCRQAGLRPVIDSSNADPRFRRNRVRFEVLPLMCEVAERDVVPLLARQAQVVALDAEILDGLAAGIDPADAKALTRAPEAVARRALRAWLRDPAAGGDHEAHPPSWAEIARVLEVVRGWRRACEISGGRRVERSRGRLRLVPPGQRGARP